MLIQYLHAHQVTLVVPIAGQTQDLFFQEVLIPVAAGADGAQFGRQAVQRLIDLVDFRMNILENDFFLQVLQLFDFLLKSLGCTIRTRLSRQEILLGVIYVYEIIDQPQKDMQ